MSENARLVLTVLCYLLALAAQLAGIALIVSEERRAAAALRRWRDTHPEQRPDGSYSEQPELNGVMEQLLGNRFDRGLAVGLLIVGVLVGTTGNFLSLA